jgi:superfamily II DNA or RNA helicase
MMSILRGYQTALLDAFQERMMDGGINRGAAEIPTGTGKTVTGAEGAVRAGGGLILTHTEEITSQWEDKLRFAARKTNLSVGVVKADRNEPAADLVIGSVQTLRNPARMARIGRRGFIIADECHHAVSPSWMDVLNAAGAWDGVPTLGLTATLKRSDGQGLGHVWQDLVFSRSISWAQRQGFLLDVIPWRVRVPDIRATDSDTALDAMLADGIAPEAVVDTWISRAWIRDSADEPSERPSTVVFAPLVKSAQAFADAFMDKGIRAEVVHGQQDPGVRAAILQEYEEGRVTVLCNAMVLTEGWDSPRTMCVVWARPTTSKPLFIQGVGRGLRPWLAAEAPPRELQRCILICVTDTTGAGLADVADLSESPLAEVEDGKSLLTAEDEYDLGSILDTEDRSYRGPVRVEEWDLAVQASTKAWKYTTAGVPFLPTAKRSAGYVFVVGTQIYVYGPHPSNPRRMGARRIATAPDLSLAMAVAEDEAQERGGDIGALLADKSRAWRKSVPSADMVGMALRSGVTQAQVDRILAQRAAGKAGKLSDLTDSLLASQVLDPIVQRIGATA